MISQDEMQLYTHLSRQFSRMNSEYESNSYSYNTIEEYASSLPQIQFLCPSQEQDWCNATFLLFLKHESCGKFIPFTLNCMNE